MPRRCNDNLLEDDPPKKRNCSNSVPSSVHFTQGELLKDITGKQWRLGKVVGVGGFGEIYLASDNLTAEVKTDCKYVAKVENHKNGPLFVEMNCYLRIAKPEMIENWKKEKKINSLGMPHYVASGSHIHKGEKYRFLILPRFDKDLEKVLQEKKILNLKSVLTISQQIIDVLEYIHYKGYIHSDVKASNILLSNEKTLQKPKENNRRSKYFFRLRNVKRPPRTIVKNLRPQAQLEYVDDIPNFDKLLNSYEDHKITKPGSRKDQVYLLDYGLACKYVTSDGKHKPCCSDERKAHAGTILFCSRDAHKGIMSRRSDLESLGYNIVYWLTGNLPWADDIENPEIVAKKKLRAMLDIEYFLRSCFLEYPKFLEDFFNYLQKLEYQEKPDYEYCKGLFRQSLKENGYKDDLCLDFDSLSVDTPKQLKKKVNENVKVRKVVKIPRPPLQSNIPPKPLLRKKVKNKKAQIKTNWFEDLTDPETILKQGREKKHSEANDTNLVPNLANLNIRLLNPTYAMIEVYNKCRERIDMPLCKGDSAQQNVNGYTSAMMSVLQKIRKREELERENMAVNLSETKNGRIMRRCLNSRKKKCEPPVQSPAPPRTTKSAVVVRKHNLQGRRLKNSGLRRSYSLRG